MFLLSAYMGGEKIGEVVLRDDPVTIGRDPGNTLVLPDASVSRQQVRIDPRGNFFLLRDLGSANGTLINDDPVEADFLEAGDTITIGRYTIQVSELKSAHEAAPVQAPPARPPRPLASNRNAGASPAPRTAGCRSEEARWGISDCFARRLRALLTDIEGNLPLLRPVIPAETLEADILERIDRDAEEMCEIVEQFAAFSELSARAARAPAHPAPAPIHPLIRKAIEEAREGARSRRILISDRLPKDLPLAAADAEKLEWAFRSILSNLVNLSSAGAIVAIEGGVEGDSLRIDFSSDEGPAIPAMDAGAPLGWIDPIGCFSGTRAPGAGIAIAMARTIILEGGGELTVPKPQEAKGRGIRLSIRLPLHASHAVPAVHDSEAPPMV